MVFPNSVISLPKKAQANQVKLKFYSKREKFYSTLEKRNVKHFEVNTPYLAAVVKGTQFRVSVDEKGAKVNVERGKVEVSNLSTGRFVLVQPGQTALVNLKGVGQSSQLQLTGSGPKAKIQQGSPRKPLVTPLKVKIKLLNKPQRATKAGTKKLKTQKSKA